MNIVPMMNDTENDGCSMHRIFFPLQEMFGETFFTDPFKTTIEEHLKAADLVTWNRIPKVEVFELQKQYGFKTLMDMDDAHYVNAGHVLYDFYKRVNLSSKLVEWMNQSTAVSVTTQRLKEKIQTVTNRPVYVIPNGIAVSQFEDYKRDYNGPTRFIYAGSATHQHDLALLKGMLRNQGPHIHIALAGYNDKNSLPWDRMEKIVSWNRNNPNYCRIYTQPMLNHTYMKVYETADVALAPLEGLDQLNTFTQYKSSLKIYEAGAKGLPIICSAVPPFTDEDIPDNNGVVFCKSTMDWINAIKRFKDLDYAREQGQLLKKWVRTNFALDVLNPIREQVYKSIIE